MDIIHIEPYQYVHIKDKTENTIYLLEGPKTYVLQSHEQVVLNPTDMVILVPNHYIKIANPVVKKDDQVIYEENFKQAKLKFGDEEIRTYDKYPDPFPLYPGEKAVSLVSPCLILSNTEALRLFALRNFKDEITKREIEAGEEWVLRGPLVYIERVEIEVLDKFDAVVIKPNTALKLRAKKDFTDFKGIKRLSGEEWLVREQGPYIVAAEEEIVTFVQGHILSDVKAIRLLAQNSFIDIYGKKRSAGEEWVITNELTSTHIPDVYEVLVEKLEKYVLNRWQYCVVMDPVGEDRKNQYGKKQLIKGETSFFLSPGEYLEQGKIFDNIILSDDEGLLLVAKERYEDEYGTHEPGERWMVYGPKEYVPDTQVEVVEVRESIPLDDNEGIYVRDIHTGEVKMVSGQTYLLKAHEELWEKELPSDVEILLQNQGTYNVNNYNEDIQTRNKSRMVTFMVPHNSVVQIFDFREKSNKIEFGPKIVKLGPYEQFTVLNLSAGNPKYENQIKSLILRLGPDFISDVVEVETSDHAKLQLNLTYSWQFSIDKSNIEQVTNLFQVKDFVGDSTKSIASRIRGIVSSVNFDSFHKDSSNIVQTGVFGKDSNGKYKKPLIFKANNLMITNVDIQSQKPTDKRMREILNQSMILSMQTNLMIQESEAQHREERANQEAEGKVERKKIEDDTDIENKKLTLLKFRVENDEINTTGYAEADIKAKVSENEIKAEADLEMAKNELEADKMKRQSELDQLRKNFAEEIKHLKNLSELEVLKVQQTSESSVEKIRVMVEAIGKETLVALASAGPDAQANILRGLGVKSLLVTDGKNPINLFNTANGLVGNLPQQAINSNR